MLVKIISGAQTGADIAGLDAGLELGLEVGGCVPNGRRIDGGRLSDDQMKRYNLIQHASSAYAPRTKVNVCSSDGTVLFGRMNSPGSRLTINICKQYRKPYIVNPIPDQLREWIDDMEIGVLNVAGNRERSNPGVYQTTFDTLVAIGRIG